MDKPTVLLVGCPDLAGPLRAANVAVLSDGREDQGVVAQRADEARRAGHDYAVVMARPSPVLVAWAQAQATQWHRVVILAEPGQQAASLPSATVLSLPTYIYDLLGALGTKAVGGVVGSAEISVDLSVQPTQHRPGLGLGPVAYQPEPEAGAEPEDWGGPVAYQLEPEAGAEPEDWGGPVAYQPEPEAGAEPEDWGGPVAYQPLDDLADVADVAWQFAVPEASPEVPTGREAGLEAGPEPATKPEAVPVAGQPTGDLYSPTKPGPAQSVTARPAPVPRPTIGPGSKVDNQHNRLASDEVFRRQAAARHDERMAPLVICFAGKGGVGKSTLALALANRATSAGLKAVVVDANRGQGDLRKYLRVGQAWLPSVVDAAVSGDPQRALATPERLMATRPSGLPSLAFGAVLAPTDSQADPALVTPDVYRSVVRAMRQSAGIVVVDTQIVEAADTSGMVERFLVPELLAGAWGLGLSDTSVGVDNLLRRLYMLSARGVGAERLMVALNRVEPESGLNQEAMARLVEPYAAWMGAVGMDTAIATAFESGGIPASQELAALLDRILWRLTGLDAFSPERKAPASKGRKWRWPWQR